MYSSWKLTEDTISTMYNRILWWITMFSPKLVLNSDVFPWTMFELWVGPPSPYFRLFSSVKTVKKGGGVGPFKVQTKSRETKPSSNHQSKSNKLLIPKPSNIYQLPGFTRRKGPNLAFQGYLLRRQDGAARLAWREGEYSRRKSR